MGADKLSLPWVFNSAPPQIRKLRVVRSDGALQMKFVHFVRRKFSGGLDAGAQIPNNPAEFWETREIIPELLN